MQAPTQIEKANIMNECNFGALTQFSGSQAYTDILGYMLNFVDPQSVDRFIIASFVAQKSNTTLPKADTTALANARERTLKKPSATAGKHTS